MFEFHHERADLHFSWDGWMQIKVWAGGSAPAEAFPARFDIREPDLRDPSRHPMYPDDGSVHLVPQTQEAFETLCDTWWRGGELCVGLRDYAADPWESRSWGITVGALRYRYTGGKHIEAAPAEVAAWRPLIALAADGRAPSTLSTEWLMQRAYGWELAWLAAHGVSDTGCDVHDAVMAWTVANLPAPNARGSIAGQFDTWIYRQVHEELTSEAWEARRDIGEYVRHITSERPWSTTRESSDGTRWNFWWCGGSRAYVWSSDQHVGPDEYVFAKRPDEKADGPTTQWLEHRADAWLLEHDASADSLTRR
jgi:hypothetical protein